MWNWDWILLNGNVVVGIPLGIILIYLFFGGKNKGVAVLGNRNR